MAANDGIDQAVVSVIYMDVDTPLIKAFHPSLGSIIVLPNLLPGGIWVLPAVGEQWLVRRIDSFWYLDARVAFQDPKMNLRQVEGTTGVGSSGPTYIVGKQVFVGNEHLDLLEKIAELEQRISDLEG